MGKMDEEKLFWPERCDEFIEEAIPELGGVRYLVSVLAFYLESLKESHYHDAPEEFENLLEKGRKHYYDEDDMFFG